MAGSKSAVLAAIAILLPALATAQDSVTEFRLAQDPKNVQGCTALDPSFTRVHTLTIKGGQAETLTITEKDRGCKWSAVQP